jgi:DNA-binding CsgD family transcriptional regulator
VDDERPGGQPPLFGREAELDVLAECVREAAGGNGSAVLLAGTAGIGTSRLLSEASRLAESAGLAVASGRADQLSSLAPLASLLEALGGGERPVLAGRDLDGLRTASDRPLEVVERLRALLSAYPRPLLIALDDVQWADPVTLLVLGTLPEELAARPVLWVLGCPPSVTLDRLSAPGVTPLRIAPLAPGAIADLARHLLGASPSPELSGLLRSAGGSPAYVVELLSGLLAEDRIDVVNGAAVARGDRLPARLHAMADRHLRPLSPAARQLVDAGSVFGRRFTAQQVGTVLGQPPEDVMAVGAEAVTARVLTVDGDGFAFPHALLRRAVYDGLPDAVRHALHRDVGRAVMAGGAPAAQAATHFGLGAPPGDEEAIQVLRDAAVELSATSPGAAADLGLKALAVLPEGDPRRPQLLVFLVPLLAMVGRTHEAERLAASALGADLDAESEGFVRLGLATGLLRGGRRAEAVHHIRRGLERSAPAGPLRANLLAVHASVLVRADPSLAARLASEAIRLGRAVGADAAVVGGLIVHAVASFRRGRLQRALTIAREAALVAAHGSAEARLRHPLRVVTLAQIGLSRFEEARATAAEAQREAELLGSSWLAGMSATDAAFAHLCAGHLVEARAEAAAVLALAEAERLDSVESQALGLLAEIAIWQGELGRARSLVDRLAAQADDPRSLTAEKYWPAALLAAAEGEPALAVRTLDDAFTELRVPRYVIGAVDPSRLPHLVRMALRAGDRERAEVAATAAERLAQRNRGQPATAGTAAHAAGLLANDARRLEQAVRLLRRGRRPLALAGALEDLGLLLAAAGERSRALPQLEEAYRIYAAHGAGREAARLRGELRRSGVRRRQPSAQARSLTGWESLTESELRTVELATEGLTNQAIADRLFVSPHTVNTHLRHAFSKLRVRSRVELTRLAMATQPPP